MVIPRASAQWSSRAFRQSTRSIRSANRTRSWKQAQRRTYASEGDHGSHQKSGFSGDLPWAIASIGITVPSVYYLIQPQIERYSGKKGGHGGHGEHGHGDSEHDEHEEKHAEESSEGGEEGDSAEGEDSQKDADSEGGSEDGQEEGGSDEGPAESDEEASPDGSKGGANKSGPDTPSDKGSDNTTHETAPGKKVEGVQFKGATSGGTRDGEQGDTRMHIPDAKGGSKKRIESHYGLKQGEATSPEQDASGDDMAATAKPAGGFGTQSGKQEGLSNTDTKHSTDIANDPDKSKKPTGGPDTAKEKGTVDPRRPAS